MPIIDQIAQDVQPVGSGLNAEGLIAGAKLAQVKQQSEEAGTKLSQLKETYEIQKGNAVVDLLGKAAKAPNPVVKKLYLGNLEKITPISSDIKEYILKAPNAQEALQMVVDKYPDFATNAGVNAQAVGMLTNLLNQDLPNAEKLIPEYLSLNTKERISQNKTVREQVRNDRQDQKMDLDFNNSRRDDARAIEKNLNDQFRAIKQVNGLLTKDNFSENDLKQLAGVMQVIRDGKISVLREFEQDMVRTQSLFKSVDDAIGWLNGSGKKVSPEDKTALLNIAKIANKNLVDQVYSENIPIYEEVQSFNPSATNKIFSKDVLNIIERRQNRSSSSTPAVDQSQQKNLAIKNSLNYDDFKSKYPNAPISEGLYLKIKGQK